MSTTTTNYNLIKPALTDAADITLLNGNWETIDTALKSIGDVVSVTLQQLSGTQSKITCGTAEPSGGSNGDVYIQIIE